MIILLVLYLNGYLKWIYGSLVIFCLFNSISVISGRWKGKNERLCAMESDLQLRPQAKIEPGLLAYQANALSTEQPGMSDYW